MAIDPTTPVPPVLPALSAGSASDSVAALQAMARQVIANTTAQLGEIVGRPNAAQTKSGVPLEQAGQAAIQDAGNAADAPSATAALRQAFTKPDTLLVRAVRTAAAEAVPRQAGLAPLMANVRAVVERPDMPIEVREAGKALLATPPSAAEIATPQGLRQAFERSGVFLEARMARAAVASPPDGLPHVAESNDMKAALLVFRGALSVWLAKAPLQASDAPSGEAAPAPLADEDGHAPQTLRGAATASTPSVPVAASSLRTSPATTTQSAAIPTPAPNEDPQPEAAASTVSTLTAPPREAVAFEVVAPETSHPIAKPPESASDDAALAARFGVLVATPKSSAPTTSPVRAALSALVQLGLMAEDAQAEAQADTTSSEQRPLAPRGYGAVPTDAPRSKVLPPPYAGGPMAGQKPASPEMPLDQSPADLVRRLLKGANGALARQDLMQIASLPEPHEAEAAETRTQQGGRLNLDVPFMTPQGMAVAQFEISHDGGGSGGGAVGPAERTYKARFSIDIEPLGPVHALVTLTGSRTRVSLWAERDETIARLRAGEEILGAALREAELSPEVAVHSGAPLSPGTMSPLGHFVDQAS